MREDVEALIFGPGLAPAGTRGTLSISITGAEIAAGERRPRVPLSEITLREVGFDKPGVEVAWKDVDGVWAAHVLDPVSARRLLTSSALSGTPQAAKLKEIQRATRVRHSAGRAVLLLLLALPIVLLVVFFMSAGRIAGWIASRVPVEQELALGRLGFDSLRSGLTLNDEGPAYDAARSIVAGLTRGSRFNYEVHIAQDASPNAFALPGGVIVVHTGLIAATARAEELAGVLAHEVQHVELRHSLRGLIKDMGLRGLWAFVMGDLGGSLAGQAALELTSLQFSRTDEREADQHGFDALVAAGIDPAGMPAFFKTLSQKAGGQIPAFLSTHPASEERDRELRRRLATVSQQTFQPLSSQPWPPK
jgi:Zn-dependent protease with chaperone function